MTALLPFSLGEWSVIQDPDRGQEPMGWNEQGNILEFSIARAYYQTHWFRVICAVFVLALVWEIERYRVRQLHRDFALTLDARLSERTSIPRELRDRLPQSGHGLMLGLQIISQLLPGHLLAQRNTLTRSLSELSGLPPKAGIRCRDCGLRLFGPTISHGPSQESQP